MKKIIVIIVLAAVIVFGYFAYKSLQKSTGGDISVNGIKELIQNKADEAQSKMQGTVDQELQDLKDQASDTLKNKVDETLGTK